MVWMFGYFAAHDTNVGFGPIRRFSNHPAPNNVLLGLGILPMASFLAIGLLIGCRRRDNHRFLRGFEAFGVVAVALYIAAAIRFPRELVLPYLSLAPVPTRTTPGMTWTTTRMLMTYSILSLWVSLPQLVFALISGFLFRNFRLR